MSEEIILADEFANALRARGCAHTTVRSCRAIVKHFERFLGKNPLDATTTDIENFAFRPHLSVVSRNFYLTRLAVFYKWAIKTARCSADPTAGIDRLRLPRTLPRPISTADLEVALDLADERTRLWLMLAAYQGLRVMEISGLHWRDVAKSELFVRGGKGDKDRMLPLHPEVKVALHAWQDRQGTSSGCVFPGYSLTGMHPHYVSSTISTYLGSLGIRATAHQLRHWFGTNTYRISKDIRLVQELMGHASPETTAIYTALDPSLGAVIIDQLTVVS